MGNRRTRRTRKTVTGRDHALPVRPAEELLIQHIPSRTRIRTILCTSLGRGQIALALREAFPDASVLCSFLDLYAAERAYAWLGTHAPGHTIGVESGSDFPDSVHDLIAIPLARKGESELARDLLQEAAFALREDGTLLTAIDHPRDEWLHRELKKLFPRVTRIPGHKGVAYVARRRGDIKRPRDFRCEFTFTDQQRVLRLFSRPGVFSHRRLDGGARALLKSLEVNPHERMLDLGCGSGAVAVAAAVRDPTIEVTAVDSNARAVECTRQSADLNDCANLNTVLNCDGLLNLENSQDLVVTNPPYFSQFRIAQLFLQTAERVLKHSGRLILVTKKPAWYEENLPASFGHIEVDQVGHYHVVRAVRFRKNDN